MRLIFMRGFKFTTLAFFSISQLCYAQPNTEQAQAVNLVSQAQNEVGMQIQQPPCNPGSQTPQSLKIREITQLKDRELPPYDPRAPKMQPYEVSRDLKEYDRRFKYTGERSLVPYLSQFRSRPLTWIDSGAGKGEAQQGWMLSTPAAPGSQLVAFAKYLPNEESIEDSIRGLSSYAKTQGVRYRYFPNETEREFIEEYRGKADLITDLHGALGYSSEFNSVLKFYADYLKVGGRLYLQTKDESFIFITPEGKTIHFAEFLSQNLKGFKWLTSPTDYSQILERTDEPFSVPQVSHVFSDQQHHPYTKIFKMPGAEKFNRIIYDTKSNAVVFIKE